MSDQEARVPPQNASAERSVIGAMLRLNSVIDDVSRLVCIGDFYSDAHQKMYSAALGVHRRGVPVDLITLANELQQRGHIEDIGGYGTLGKIYEAAPTAANAEYHAEIVRDHALTRNLIQVSTSILRNAYDQIQAPADMLREAERDILAIGDRNQADEPVLLSVSIDQAMEKLWERQDKGLPINGLSTTLQDLDDILGGLRRKDLTTLAARPRDGKSTLARQIAVNAAEQGENVYFVTLEVGRVQLANQLLSTYGRVPSHRFRSGALSETELANIMEASQRLGKAMVWTDDVRGKPVSHFVAQARRLKRRCGLGLFVVDYLGLLVAENRKLNRVEQIGEMTRSLVNVAHELDIPVLLLCQLSREAAKNSRPRLEDLRECVVGETRLTNADTGELTRIKDIVPGTRVLGIDGSQKVTSAIVERVWSTGIKPVFRLTTNSGRCIEGTDTHPIFTEDGWKHLGELSCQKIAVAFNTPVEGSDSGHEDACRLLGYMAGNGSLQKHRTLGLIIPDDEAFADASGIIHQMFPDVGIKLRGNRAYNDAWISRTYENGHGKPFGNPMIEWLRSVGFYGLRDETKFVPDLVFKSRNGPANFLAGYLATDGCVKKKNAAWAIQYDTTSIGLARGVTELCARIGVHACISPPTWGEKSTKPLYRVKISSDWANLLRFAETVKVPGKKGRLLQSLSSDRPMITRYSAFALPSKVSSMASAAFPAWRDQGKQMGRRRCQEIAAVAKNASLHAWAHSDLVWDDIRSIEPCGEQEVFDIVIPGMHCFLTDGIVAHNSGCIEQDSNNVLLMWRDPEREEMVQIEVAKQKEGREGIATVFFKRDITMFMNAQGGGYQQW